MSAGTEPAVSPSLSRVVDAFERRYPPSGAESWDAVGLVLGDPAQTVRKVLFAIDPVDAVVDEAIEWGADLLVTHHPLFLRPVHSMAATTFKGRVAHRLVGAGIALQVAHTNADAAADGVADALAGAIGLVDLEPLVPAPSEPLDKHVVFTPVDSADAVIDAMASAGAGSIGAYTRCSWTTTGFGRFTPGAGAQPAVGAVGRATEATETRVEMVAPRSARSAVVTAMRRAHPYEMPAFDVLELAPWPGRTGIGRLGRLAAPETFGEFGQRVAESVPATAQGVRLAGDLAAQVLRVAVVGGSGDSLFDAVRASGADVYVTADLRHHPASEARERAEHDSGGRPFLVDLAHFASEWPWLGRAAATLVADLAAAGATVETRVSVRVTDPWTARIPNPDRPRKD